jgi:hypothetical protein
VNIKGQAVTILGGAGLVGMAIARRVLALEPTQLVVSSLREAEARQAVAELRPLAEPAGIELVPEWGDLFVRESHKTKPRAQLLDGAQSRAELLDDLFGAHSREMFDRSSLVQLLEHYRPTIVIDCVNTATAIAYQDVFASAARLFREVVANGTVGRGAVEAHLTTLHLPQLIRHLQLLLEGLRRAGTVSYLKIGTSGTGGMGLNVPFTHSEQRPSRQLLAKASMAGAHTALLFLMGRTPNAPSITEVKPTAAIAWKKIGFGPVVRGGEPIPRFDSTQPVPLDAAFGPEPPVTWSQVGDALESVYLDAGENGLFSLSEFEAISSLRLMEVVTPEEIAEVAIDEIQGRPTGHDVVSALDSCSMGPTYRGGMLREVALDHMERLEREHGVRSVAFEMLGPPRLSKLLFEAAILERLYQDLEPAAELDPEETARRATELIEEDSVLRSDILSAGIPILTADGRGILRGPRVQAPPHPEEELDADRWSPQGWVDLRAESWVLWRERCRRVVEAHQENPGPEEGSVADFDLRAASGRIRAGTMAAYVFRVEDQGERIKR